MISLRLVVVIAVLTGGGLFAASPKDLDNQFGNWPLTNRQMAKALAYKGYDYKLEFGPGFHGSKHAGVRLPDTLRWVWRDWK